MKTKIIFSILLSAIFWVVGCGVKGKPLPPEKGSFIGTRQRTLTQGEAAMPESLNPEVLDEHLRSKSQTSNKVKSKGQPAPKARDAQ